MASGTPTGTGSVSDTGTDMDRGSNPFFMFLDLYVSKISPRSWIRMGPGYVLYGFVDGFRTGKSSASNPGSLWAQSQFQHLHGVKICSRNMIGLGSVPGSV